MNEEIICKGKSEKQPWMNEKMICSNDDELYTVYIKILGQFFFDTYLLICLKKDTSVLLKVINIWASS